MVCRWPSGNFLFILVVVAAAVLQDSWMVVSAEEDRLIGQVVNRLVEGFPQVPQDTVHEIVGSIHHRFDEATIRDFVPLFVERHTKEKLASLAGTASHPV